MVNCSKKRKSACLPPSCKWVKRKGCKKSRSRSKSAKSMVYARPVMHFNAMSPSPLAALVMQRKSPKRAKVLKRKSKSKSKSKVVYARPMNLSAQLRGSPLAARVLKRKSPKRAKVIKRK